MVLNASLILLSVLLVLLNGFFVAAEFAMVKLRHTKIAAIKRMYGTRGMILAKVHKNLDAYLSACQLGITLASLGLGWIGEPAVAHVLEPVFEFCGITSKDLIVFISYFVAFTIISLLHIVIGELVPKSYALRQSERVSVYTAIPLYVFYWLMYPAIWILNNCAKWILIHSKLDKVHEGEYTYSPDELKMILSSGHLFEQLSKQEVELLRHSIEFVDLEVVDVMRPIEEMISLNADENIDRAMPIILQHRYSRYPVNDKQKKEIVGIVHVKDILLALHHNEGNQSLESIMRPILKVSRYLSAIKLLNELQEGMPHFALVYSGRDTPVGFVTLDNIFQVLVGRVRDEFHKIEESWTIAPDGAFLMNGNSALYVLERAIDIDMELDEKSDETSDTIFGLVLTKLGRLPKEGEKIDFNKFYVIVNKMKGHKILEVAVYPRTKIKAEH